MRLESYVLCYGGPSDWKLIPVKTTCSYKQVNSGMVKSVDGNSICGVLESWGSDVLVSLKWSIAHPVTRNIRLCPRLWTRSASTEHQRKNLLYIISGGESWMLSSASFLPKRVSVCLCTLVLCALCIIAFEIRNFFPKSYFCQKFWAESKFILITLFIDKSNIFYPFSWKLLWPMSFFFVRLKSVLALPVQTKFLSIDFSLFTITNAEIIPTNGTHFK